MKKKILYYLTVLAAVVLVSSCESDPIIFDSANSFIAFTASGSLAAEEGNMVGIPVLVTASMDAPSVTVDFAFDTESSTAVEGVNFSLVNESQTLSMNNGWGYDTIWVQPIDNEIFTGNLDLIIDLTANSKDYPFGVVSSHTLTIVDNEHPLGKWIGGYSVAATDYWSYFGPEVWDNVVTAPDPDDVNNLIITGLGGPAYGEHTPITGVVDLDSMTITLTSGSEIGTHGQYGGPLAIYACDEFGNLYEEPIVGTISEDGTIELDYLGILFVGGTNEGLAWGGYSTVWTKTGKKAARVYPPPSEIREMKLEQ